MIPVLNYLGYRNRMLRISLLRLMRSASGGGGGGAPPGSSVRCLLFFVFLDVENFFFFLSNVNVKNIVILFFSFYFVWLVMEKKIYIRVNDY